MEHRSKVIEYCETFFGASGTWEEWGLNKYDRSVVWSNGARFNFHSDHDRCKRVTNGLEMLEMPGSSIETMDETSFYMFIKGLAQYEARCRRIDVRYLDFERVITPKELFDSVYEVDLLGEEFRREFTGFINIDLKRKGGVRKDKKNGLVHDEVDFGKRGSYGGGKYLRVYDKWLETRFEINAICWELELSKERSEKMYSAILNTPINGLPNLFGVAIGGCIDFKNRPVNGNGELIVAGHKNWQRCSRKWFWTRLLAKLGGRLPLTKSVEPKQVEKSALWFQEQVAGTLQMLDKAYGIDAVLEVVTDICGRSDRLNSQHQAALKEFERNAKDKQQIPTIKSLRSWADAHAISLESPTEVEKDFPVPPPPGDFIPTMKKSHRRETLWG